jgi:hypothetical protein
LPLDFFLLPAAMPAWWTIGDVIGCGVLGAALLLLIDQYTRQHRDASAEQA